VGAVLAAALAESPMSSGVGHIIVLRPGDKVLVLNPAAESDARGMLIEALDERFNFASKVLSDQEIEQELSSAEFKA
jgi:hypothetical protein